MSQTLYKGISQHAYQQRKSVSFIGSYIGYADVHAGAGANALKKNLNCEKAQFSLSTISENDYIDS